MPTSATITFAVRARLAQLLRLLLSSDKSGEIVASKVAINKTLTAAGLDFYALADAVENPAPPARRPEQSNEQEFTWRHKVRFCIDHDRWLTEWEREFAASLLSWNASLTTKQQEKLDRIVNKIKFREERK
jgi:hypothetical protein